MVSASQSRADGKDGRNIDQDTQRATLRELEQLPADLPTGNQDIPGRSAAPSCVCGEAPSQCPDRADGPWSNRHLSAHQMGPR